MAVALVEEINVHAIEQFKFWNFQVLYLGQLGLIKIHNGAAADREAEPRDI